jgi:hypothetical protein
MDWDGFELNTEMGKIRFWEGGCCGAEGILQKLPNPALMTAQVPGDG